MLRCLLLASLACATLALKGHHLFSVKSDSQRVAKILMAEMANPTVPGLDFWNEPQRHRANDVQMSVPPTSVDALKLLLTAQGVAYEVVEKDIEAKFAAQVANRKPYVKGHVADFDYFEYHPYDEIMDWAYDMAAQYPDLCEIVHIGWSYEEREIIGLRITGPANPNGKKKILTNYCIHSREWLSPATGLYISAQFLMQYTSSPEVARLMNNIEFTFVPVTNPDGYYHTWSGLLNRLWRKTRSPNVGSTCIGTDPNRNWGFGWGLPGASADPCNDAYRGPSAFSEIETRSLSNYLLANGPFHGYIDVHCCGNMWMTPWGFNYTTPPFPDYEYQMDQNERVRQAIYAVRGTNYSVGPISDVIYQASGSTVDWAYGDQSMNVLYSVAVELSGNFVSPPSIIGETVPEVFAGFLEFCSVVLNHDNAALPARRH